MKKINKWAVEGTQYMYDVNAVEAYTAGALDMRNKIFNLIKLTEEINSDNIKQNPELTSYLLLDLADKIRNFGEEENE